MTIDLNKMLQPGGIVPIDIPTTAALAAEIKRQHAALERKDALLWQALEALEHLGGWSTETCRVFDAIKQELAK